MRQASTSKLPGPRSKRTRERRALTGRGTPWGCEQDAANNSRSKSIACRSSMPASAILFPYFSTANPMQRPAIRTFRCISRSYRRGKVSDHLCPRRGCGLPPNRAPLPLENEQGMTEKLHTCVLAFSPDLDYLLIIRNNQRGTIPHDRQKGRAPWARC